MQKNQVLYIAYILRGSAGKYFCVLCNARNKRKAIWQTEMYSKKTTAKNQILNLPIMKNKISIVDTTLKKNTTRTGGVKVTHQTP